MAFDDALEDGQTALAGVNGIAVGSPEALGHFAPMRRAVILANLDPPVVAAACPGLTTVLGPGFSAATNVHIAIETMPGQDGGAIEHGPAAKPTGEAALPGGAGTERFVYAPCAGAWTPAATLGQHLEAGTPIGRLGRQELPAPIGGCVRGLVRAAPGGVARGMTRVEIDPQPGAASTGLAPRDRRGRGSCD